MVLGKDKIVSVSKSKGRSKSSYHCLTYVNSSGDVERLFLTENEKVAALNRAKKNSAFYPKIGFWDRLVKLLFV